VARDFDEAGQAIDMIMKDRNFGEAGDRVVIEECLNGEELSFFAISDGHGFVPVMSAQDHKRVFDHDAGPNTGGMGAYTNPPLYTPQLREQIINEIIRPTINAMQQEGHPYQGVLYAGLMLTASGPKVLEFNARFGDPETQVLMPMIDGDLFPVLEAAARGNLGNCQVQTAEGACVAVVVASGGYPGSFAKGYPITGLNDLEPDTMVFHAGTKVEQGSLVTDGGRVLAIAAKGCNIADAVQKVYKEIKKVHFQDMHYRNDIAHRALR
jgi:phosphoribosylamine--glycine ligase